MQNYNKSLKLEINSPKCWTLLHGFRLRLTSTQECVKRSEKAAYMFNFCKKPRTNCPINNSFTNFVRINNKHNNPALHCTSG